MSLSPLPFLFFITRILSYWGPLTPYFFPSLRTNSSLLPPAIPSSLTPSSLKTLPTPPISRVSFFAVSPFSHYLSFSLTLPPSPSL
ncbi:uncharacterized protein RJT20DRAFT_130661 [Scheffersomyces xylosifermentans]|uniref:uncharacterized protein n=1 Tax=Scheffersomyces xylosifermentans TaxID=1304137 RepID=UPI00315C88C9